MAFFELMSIFELLDISRVVSLTFQNELQNIMGRNLLTNVETSMCKWDRKSKSVPLKEDGTVSDELGGK